MTFASSHFNITGRVARLRPTAINSVLREAKQAQAEGLELVSLMRGQPDTPTAGHIVEAAVRALRNGRTGYADNQGEPGLRSAVAEALARDHGLRYDPDREILITDGATLGICTALATLAGPGESVLLPDPIYDAYTSPIRLWDADPVPVPSEIRGGRFTFTRESLESRCTTTTRAVLVNTPWNPVGTVLSRDELQSVLDVTYAYTIVIISDEIYASLVYDGTPHQSPASLSDDAKARTILVSSLSKTYAMTGWRVGYCAGPAKLIAAMALVLQQSSRGPATFVQDAAEYALRSDQDCVRRMNAEYQARRDLSLHRLRGIPGVVPMKPEGGLFVMLDVRGLRRSSDEIRQFLLKEAGVVVVHGSAYGPAGEGTLRVSFAAGGEVLDKGLARLHDGLSRLAAVAGRGEPT
jgi:aspartate/methionine/tyrosine aminotransferase